ncbi:MAG TPA: SRPBCC family protein [Thermoanaerobaculaceae bacterium]|nr:SRPBCC family protein [Thermoanaerobaculaceae bacterium]
MTAPDASTDRIEKSIVVRAPRGRVWRALSDAAEFGAWFGVDFDPASFAPGATVRGRITHPGYEHITMEIVIERMVEGRLLSYRWHPYAVDPAADYSKEPTTLVTFELHDAPEGTLVTVVESGFDRIPLHRRAEAFRMNVQGWAGQMRNIEAHVAGRH